MRPKRSRIPDDEDDEWSLPDTVEALAEQLEMQPDEFLDALKLKVKASGEEQEISLKEAVSGYQRQTDYDRDKTALGEDRKEFKQVRQQHLEQWQRNTAVMDTYYRNEQNRYEEALQELRNVDVRSLSEGEYREFTGRERDLQEGLQTYQRLQEQLRTQYDQAFQEQHKLFLIQETETLKGDGWKDEDFQAAIDTVLDWGFDPDEARRIADARLFRAARQARRDRKRVQELEAQLGAQKQVAKKVKRVIPKTLKRTRRQSSSSKRTQQYDKLMGRLMRTGHPEDADAALASLL